MIGLAGHLRLRAAACEGGRTAVAEQAFRAPFHISKPYWDVDGGILIVQVVNPTAGILAGDELHSEIETGMNAALLVTTPSASRVFTMRGKTAECRQRFSVERSGWLEVSPEPLVPHRESRYRQSTEIDISPDAGLFFVDQLLPGRIGFGETWSWTELRLDLSVRIGGELVLRECFAHTGAELRDLAEFAGSGPTACFANAILVAPAGSDRMKLANILGSLHRDGVWIGASALRRGGYTIRIVASDPIRLRDTLASVRALLSEHCPHLRCQVRRL